MVCPSWRLDCSTLNGARDTGDDNIITSCSRFSVTVVRTVTRDKGDAVFPRCVASFFRWTRLYDPGVRLAVMATGLLQSLVRRRASLFVRALSYPSGLSDGEDSPPNNPPYRASRTARGPRACTLRFRYRRSVLPISPAERTTRWRHSSRDYEMDSRPQRSTYQGARCGRALRPLPSHSKH